MPSLAVHLYPWFDWLLRTTWQAGVLVGLILLIQKVAGRRLGVRGRYWLWMLLLVRLAMPWTPHSGLSLYNLLPTLSLWRYGIDSGKLARAAISETKGSSARESLRGDASGADGAERAESVFFAESPREWLERRALVVLPLLWSVGVVGLTGCIVTSSIRLRRTVHRGRTVTDPLVLDVLENCKRLMRTRAAVTIVVTNAVRSPALCGIRQPRLLLPEQTLVESSPNSLRHIFLHELAHLRRRDILVSHAASLLHVLHWFNPLIALGLWRMRADRELACDGMALSVLDSDESIAYGHTIVQQIEGALSSESRWTMAALCGDKARVRERITMIAQFEKSGYRWSLLAMVLIGFVACAGLTEGLAGSEALARLVEPPSTPWDAYARGDFPTTHQDKHANIVRCCLRNMETGKYLTVDGERVVCDADEPGEAGLWELRFDEVSNAPTDAIYYYSVAARKYLMSDERGNLAVSATEPEEAARWGNWPRPQGVWIVSHRFPNGYLRPSEEGRVQAGFWGRDARSYWDVHQVWRVKTSDNPRANPQWQREHVPGLD